MAKIPKEIVTTRISRKLLDQIDALADRTGRTRSEVIERVLIFGIDQFETAVATQEHPIGGKIWELLLSPKVAAFLERVSGDEFDQDELEKLRKHVRRSRNGPEKQPRPAVEGGR